MKKRVCLVFRKTVGLGAPGFYTVYVVEENEEPVVDRDWRKKESWVGDFREYCDAEDFGRLKAKQLKIPFEDFVQ